MSKTIKRSFILGEEWLYYKVYCGVRIADLILEEVIAPLSEELLEKKLIHEWFFIRYNDPDPHLRLRFKLSDVKKIGGVINVFNKYVSIYFQANLIWKVQTDTYVRELERYGLSTMTLSEQLFFHDSLLIINALAEIKDEEMYFLFILKCIDSFLTDFQLSKSEKLLFSKQNALAYQTEFNLEKSTIKSLAKKYRFIRINLNKVMTGVDVNKKFISIEKSMTKRNQSLRSLSVKILAYNKKGVLEVDLHELLRSYLHMLINRSFRDKQRFYEMIAYDFLFKYYTSNFYR